MYLKDYLQVLIALLLSIIVISCKDNEVSKSNEQVVISFKKEGTLKLLREANDSTLKTLDIEIADTDYETQTGLMYRTELGKQQGMLFIFAEEDYHSFYMKNTKIPLDIIYIDSDSAIVSVQKNAQPFSETSLPSEVPAKYVLEINSGLFDAWQLEIGDKIKFEFLE